MVGVALFAFAGTTHAQPIQQSATPAVTRVELKPVEQGIGDVGPLSTNLRSQPTDLRMPIRFDRVYRLSDVAASQPIWRGPGRSTANAQPDGFVRFNAGVSAVFPFSAYATGRGGLIAEVPPGTVFHLGLKPQPADGRFSSMDSPARRAGLPLNAANAGPMFSAAAGASVGAFDQPRNMPINRLVDTSAAANPPASALDRVQPQSLWTSEAYRHERLTALIAGARNVAGPITPRRDAGPKRSATPGMPREAQATKDAAPRSTPAHNPASSHEHTPATPPAGTPTPRQP
jgi:hypothetical protein